MNENKYFGFYDSPYVKLSGFVIHHALSFPKLVMEKIKVIYKFEIWRKTIFSLWKINTYPFHLYCFRIVVKTYELITVPANTHSFEYFWWTFTFR